MATKPKLVAKKPVAAAKAEAGASATDALYDISSALGAIGQVLGEIDMKDVAKFNLESIAEAINNLANAQAALADAAAMRIIAEHGSAEERSKVLETLRRRID